jgi:hypothetical protein
MSNYLAMPLALIVAPLLLGRSNSPVGDVMPPNPQSYKDAKFIADADDARLSSDAMFLLRHAQGKVLGVALRRCERPRMDLSGFSIVLSVGSNGSILQTWRKGESQLALCVEKELLASSLEWESSRPFYTSVALSRDAP